MTGQALRVGDRCEVDLAAREVRLDGRPRRVEPKVFALLAYLLQRRDRVVTKDELLEALWPRSAASAGVLARAVMKARTAIGDDGEPGLISTVPRVGYRLVAPQGTGGVDAPPAAGAHGARLRLALLPFENATGDPALEWIELGLMSLLAHELEADSRLSVIALPSLLAAIEAAQGAADQAGAVRDAVGAHLVVDGRVERDGLGYRLQLRAAGTPAPAPFEVAAASGGELAQRTARELLSALFPGSPPIEVAVIASNDPLAVTTFARGLQAMARQRWRQALNLLKMTLDLAPGCPVVMLELLRTIAALADLDEGRPVARRLLARAERQGDLLLAARVHLALGRLHLNRMALVQAGYRVEKGLRLMGENGPPDELAHGHLLRAHIAGYRQQMGEANAALDQVRILCERSGNRVMPLWRLNTLAAMEGSRGAYERAAELAMQSATGARELHALRLLVTACTNAVMALSLLGRLAEAAAHAEEAYATALLLKSDGDLTGAAASACLLYRLTRTPAAAQRIVASLPNVDTLKPMERQWALQALGHHAASVGEHAQAALHFGRALQLHRETTNRLNEEGALAWLVCALVQSGQLAEAEAEIDRAERGLRADQREFQRVLWHCRALLAHAGAHARDALALLERVLDADPTPMWRAWALVDAAWLYAELGRGGEARRTLGKLSPGFANLPVCAAAMARAAFAVDDRAGAQRHHRRYLESSTARAGDDFLGSLGAWYAGTATGPVPAAPSLPSRL